MKTNPIHPLWQATVASLAIASTLLAATVGAAELGKRGTNHIPRA